MKNTALLFILVACISLASCTKDEFKPREWGIEPELELDPIATILTPSHPSDTISIRTNYLNFEVSESLYWINLVKLEDASAIVVTADPIKGNENYREGYITITVERGKYKMSRDFVIMQFKNDIMNYE